MFHFRQLVDSTDEVYGNVSFELNIEADDTATRKGVLAVTEFSEGPSPGCQYVELIVANCGTSMSENVDVRGWIINDNSGILTGECETTGVNRGHYRLAYSDIWARVPVGSTIMLYNVNNNCYNLADTFTYDTANAKYWIPVGADGPLYIEQFIALENNTICSYCSDTGMTIYNNAGNWIDIVGLDSVFDAVQVLCPGCTSEIPSAPVFYFGAGHFQEEYDLHWTPPAIGETSIGLVLASNMVNRSGFKYVFVGNSAEELLDPTRWDVSIADNAGGQPFSLGNVTIPFKSLVTSHQLNLPCCATAEEREEQQSKGSNTRKHLSNINAVEAIKVYPNPANNLLYFEFPLSDYINIRIMDITGKVIEEQVLHNVRKSTFDVKSYAPGLYIYQIASNGKRQKGKVTICK